MFTCLIAALSGPHVHPALQPGKQHLMQGISGDIYFLFLFLFFVYACPAKSQCWRLPLCFLAGGF
jgi:hypothetical protein